MNAVCNLDVDSSASSFTHNQQAASTALNTMIDDLNLFDVWRFQNPGTRDYTCVSSCHKSFSRIDYFLLSRGLKDCTAPVKFLPATLADHNPLVFSIDLSFKSKKSQWWRFNTSLLNNATFVSEFRTKLSVFLQDNRGSVEDNRLVWMATKGFISDFTTSYASHMKKVRNFRIKELEEKCLCLERALKKNYSDTINDELKIVKQELNDLLRRRAKFIIHRIRLNYYCNGSEPSRLLVLKLKQCESRASIGSIHHPIKGLISNPTEINSSFKTYYEDLYTLSGSFFSLGPDGIPLEVLLHFWDLLGPVLLSSIQTAIEKGAFHEHTNVALISLLPKKGKDLLHCSNYRPISLINSDLKIWSKLQALRLEHYMDKLIHMDQTGLMRGCLAADNVRRLLHVIEESKQLQELCCLVTRRCQSFWQDWVAIFMGCIMQIPSQKC